MTGRAIQRRWAVSLADIGLLVACIAILNPAPQPGVTARAAARAPLPTLHLPLNQLFFAGEARLTPAGRAALQPWRAQARRSPHRLSVAATGQATMRLDAWELAAARTAAIARVIGPVDLAAPHDGDSDARLIPTGTALALPSAQSQGE